MTSKTTRKNEIIAAARVVFNKYGYKKTTMVDIAKEVDLNQATLYHYFENKEEIFIEKILADHAEFRSKRLKFILDEPTIERKIMSFFGHKLDFFYGNRIYEQIAELNKNKITKKHRKMLENLSKQEKAFIKSLLEKAIQNDEIPTDINTTQLTKLVFRIFQGLRVENQFNYFITKQEPRTDLLMKEMEQTIHYLFKNLKKTKGEIKK